MRKSARPKSCWSLLNFSWYLMVPFITQSTKICWQCQPRTNDIEQNQPLLIMWQNMVRHIWKPSHLSAGILLYDRLVAFLYIWWQYGVGLDTQRNLLIFVTPHVLCYTEFQASPIPKVGGFPSTTLFLSLDLVIKCCRLSLTNDCHQFYHIEWWVSSFVYSM